MGSFFARYLSAKLLALTVGFVLLAELLLFIPSVANYRQGNLQMRAESASLVAEALLSRGDSAMPNEASQMLAKQFMMQTDADFLAGFSGDGKVVILGEAPPAEIVYTEDLRTPRRFPPILLTAMEFFASGDAHMRLVTDSPVPGQDRMEMFIPCAAIGAELRAYAWRIFVLSVIIALFVGGLIYLAMLRLIVAPVQTLAKDMTSFREAPQARQRIDPPARRADEIGQLQREFHEVKQSLRAAFRQRERLASLGLSVTKINHDLRNVLSTALLMADRLSMEQDPKLAEMGERLTRTVERGVGLTEEVLTYSSAREPEPQLEAVPLRGIVADVFGELRTAFPKVRATNSVFPGIVVRADAEQLHRILSNLSRNSAQAMIEHGTIRPVLDIVAEPSSDTVIVTISDTGPGLPEKVEDRLFLPFTRGTAESSTGLGLSISKELAEGMGGSLELLDTGPDGTRFILGLGLS